MVLLQQLLQDAFSLGLLLFAQRVLVRVNLFQRVLVGQIDSEVEISDQKFVVAARNAHILKWNEFFEGREAGEPGHSLAYPGTSGISRLKYPVAWEGATVQEGRARVRRRGEGVSAQARRYTVVLSLC